MRTLRGGILSLLALVSLAGAATAQDPTVEEDDFNTTTEDPDESYLESEGNASGEDPTLDEGDFDTTTPTPDESYLGAPSESSSSDPTLTESDFDTSVPPADESYLDAGAHSGSTDGRGVPGPALVGVLAVLGLLALARRGQ